MSENAAFADHIVDLLVDFAKVEAKRMFGGFGIFREGLMFGLIADGSLYLKADDQNRSIFEDQGLSPFIYYKGDKPFQLSYYLAPESFFEDEQETQYWAGLGWEAALRAPKKKKRPRKK